VRHCENERKNSFLITNQLLYLARRGYQFHYCSQRKCSSVRDLLVERKKWLTKDRHCYFGGASVLRSSNPRVFDRNSKSLPRSCQSTAASCPISEADAASRQRTPAGRSRMIRRELDPVSGQAANFGIDIEEHLSSAKGRSCMAFRLLRFAYVARFHAL
jgi:hypothetical protein